MKKQPKYHNRLKTDLAKVDSFVAKWFFDRATKKEKKQLQRALEKSMGDFRL